MAAPVEPLQRAMRQDPMRQRDLFRGAGRKSVLAALNCAEGVLAAMMIAHLTMLALVTDAFGGRGGIAQYNRDFLSAVVSCGAVSSITVLPRHAVDPALPPEAIKQLPSKARAYRLHIGSAESSS